MRERSNSLIRLPLSHLIYQTLLSLFFYFQKKYVIKMDKKEFLEKLLVYCKRSYFEIEFDEFYYLFIGTFDTQLKENFKEVISSYINLSNYIVNESKRFIKISYEGIEKLKDKLNPNSSNFYEVLLYESINNNLEIEDLLSQKCFYLDEKYLKFLQTFIIHLKSIEISYDEFYGSINIIYNNI